MTAENTVQDYTSMDAAALLNALGDDAMAWAVAFNQHAVKLGYSSMDEGWLVGWFANAIEHSADVRMFDMANLRGQVTSLSAELQQATDRLDEVYSKDYGKTREINILTGEVRSLSAELVEARKALASLVELLDLRDPWDNSAVTKWNAAAERARAVLSPNKDTDNGLR